MTIDQVIAAQEANEADVSNGRINFATFDARRTELERAYGIAMTAIMKRIAAA